jgi:hypothetical protein
MKYIGANEDLRSSNANESRHQGVAARHRRTADERSAEGAGYRRKTRLHEDAGQRAGRPHSWLWLGGRRGHGGHANGDAGMHTHSTLRDAIFAHPTMAEGLGFVLANVPARKVQQATPQILAV